MGVCLVSRIHRHVKLDQRALLFKRCQSVAEVFRLEERLLWADVCTL